MRTLVLILVACMAACGGQTDGPDWPISMDPLAQREDPGSGTVIRQHEPGGLSRLDAAVRRGEVSQGEAYEIRLNQMFGLRETPRQYMASAHEEESDLLLQDLSEAFDTLSPGDRDRVRGWLLPVTDPEHPLHARVFGRPSQSSGSTGSPFRLASVSEPVVCPHDHVLQPEGIFIPENEDILCWVKPNDHAVMYWPAWPAVMADSAMVQIAEEAAAQLNPIFDHFLPLFGSSRANLMNTQGDESFHIGLMPFEFNTVPDNLEDRVVLGIHRYFQNRRTSVVDVYFWPDSVALAAANRWFRQTLAHEVFHGLQYQHVGTSTATFATPSKWVVEGMASWAAQDFVASNDLELGSMRRHYDRRMTQFADRISLGIDSVSYPAHLVWHDLVTQQDRTALEAVVGRHELTGDSESALHQLNIEEHLHPFAEALLNRDPWSRFVDRDGVPFPQTWQKSPDVELSVAALDVDVADLLMPRVSAKRVRIDLQATGGPGGSLPMPYLALRVHKVSGAEALDAVKASVRVGAGTEEAIELEVGETRLICFDGSDPECEGAVVYPRPDSVDVIVSNADFDLPNQRVLVTAATMPITFQAVKIRVGETETGLRGLTFNREDQESFTMEADHMWFEFEADLYERLIPDDAGEGEVNLSQSLIRDYVREHAQFRGEMELKYAFDDATEPIEMDGRHWVPLTTERGDAGNFFSTPHRFFITPDSEWFQALGGSSGALGPGGQVYLRMIDRLNRMRFPEGSFAHSIQGWFTQAMTLGAPADGETTTYYTVDQETGQLMFRAGNTTLWLRPE